MILRWYLAIAFAPVLWIVLGSQVQAAGATDDAAVPGAEVTITSDGLSPTAITVTVGATVTWHNASGQAVRLSSDPFADEENPLFLPMISGGGGQTSASSGAPVTSASADWTSDPIADGGEFTRTYNQAGTFTYYGDHASGALGRIAVVSGAIVKSKLIDAG